MGIVNLMWSNFLFYYWNNKIIPSKI